MAAQKTNTKTKVKRKQVSPKATKVKKVTKRVTKKVAPSVSNFETIPQVKTKKISKKLSVIFLLVFLAVLVYTARGLIIVATVNGKPIYRWTVIDRLEKLGGQQVVDEIIQEELINQEAARLGVKANEDEVSKELEKARQASEAQGMPLETALEQANLTIEEYTKSIRIQYTVRAMLQDQIEVTDEEVNTTYNEYKDSESFADIPEEEAKKQILEGLKDQKLQEKVVQWMDDLKNKASIKTVVEY
ncbi:SurA N-terminal domain-containing protein [Candidatus Woesebacteria bacterium]|nr:MAG: SurA N-terminal domain-containing protein [Candidatus Woesebacteria bacterium]